MKFLAKISLAGLLVCHGGFCADPQPGWYGGLIIGISYSPSIDFYSPPIDAIAYYLNPLSNPFGGGELAYDVGGNGGVHLGYRWCSFRFEGETNFNSNSYDKLHLGNLVIKSNVQSANLRLRGETSVISALFNVYYDFYRPDASSTGLVPYIGLGAGYAHVKSQIRFYYGQTFLTGTQSVENSNAPVVQGIAGFSYFLDDFTAVGLDARYRSTGRVNTIDEARQTRIEAVTLNIVANFAFDRTGN